MSKTFATPEYEDQLLEALLGRIERDLEIEHLGKTDKTKQKEKILQEMQECYDDPVYFIENYLYTDKNPGFFSDRIQTLVPYLLFDYQVETIDKFMECVEKRQNAFMEKSRQMGVSWLLCAFSLWGWLFRDWKIFFVSQKQDYVDKIGDMQSLFQKIRFMVAELPKWILPPGFDIDKHMPRLRIYKPKGYGTGSITGDSANPNAGTGGSYKFVFCDEFSKIQNAKSINTSLQATTGTIIYNGTPFGKFNEHYKMRTLALRGAFPLIRLHWSLNPMYTAEWYADKTKGMLPEQIAQELEINYDASVEGRVYPSFGSIPNGDCVFGRYEYNYALPLYISIDNSHGGTDNHAIIVAQTTPNGKIRIIDSHQFPSYTTIDQCASLLAKQPVGKFDDNALEFLERIKGYKTPVYIADPYDSSSTWNDTSISKIYRTYGITLNVPDRKKTIQERIRVCQVNMGRVEVNVDTEDAGSMNWEMTSAIQNARYPKRDDTSQSTVQNHNPVHDSTSHFRTSFEYLVNFIVEQEESRGIIGGNQQKQTEKRYVQRANYITGELEWREE